MNKKSNLVQEDFDALLNWLSANREEAGKIYEQVREGLIRFFCFKGCNDAENLADETINRVAAKVSTLDTSQNFKKNTYFYGFATNILFEHNRKAERNNIQLDTLENFQHPNSESNENSDDYRFKCLDNCLKELSTEDQEIIIEYYLKEKTEKIEARKQLAVRLKCEMNALQVRVFRLRNLLRKCVRKCLKNS